MQAQLWGLKTFYYSLINKQGARVEEPAVAEVDDFDDVENCEACKL